MNCKVFCKVNIFPSTFFYATLLGFGIISYIKFTTHLGLPVKAQAKMFRYNPQCFAIEDGGFFTSAWCLITSSNNNHTYLIQHFLVLQTMIKEPTECFLRVLPIKFEKLPKSIANFLEEKRNELKSALELEDSV